MYRSRSISSQKVNQYPTLHIGATSFWQNYCVCDKRRLLWRYAAAVTNKEGTNQTNTSQGGEIRKKESENARKCNKNKWLNGKMITSKCRSKCNVQQIELKLREKKRENVAPNGGAAFHQIFFCQCGCVCQETVTITIKQYWKKKRERTHAYRTTCRLAAQQEVIEC